MIIDINQINTEKKNEFEILFNNQKKYSALLPFINIKGSFNLEKLRDINLYDLNNNVKYKTNYNYIDNQIEEFIPLKYILTKSQKFNQFVFKNDTNEISIFFQMRDIWDGTYIIKFNDEIFNCFSVEDGYFRHISIYKNDTQIAELLKPNIVIDGKDTYRVYIINNYEYIADAIVMFALYLDRTECNSSYLKANGKYISKRVTYSKANKYYNKNWISQNFDANDYFDKINAEINKTKNDVKQYTKKILKIMAIFWIILILITILLLIIIF